MQIPYQQLSSEALQHLLENYALREGTEYGKQDVSLPSKVRQLIEQLEANKICIVFDAITETCDVVTMREWEVTQMEKEQQENLVDYVDYNQSQNEYFDE